MTIYLYICYNIDKLRELRTLTNMVASARKEKEMDENMSDYQFETVLKMILTIIDGCETLDEASKKIKALLKKPSNK